MTVLNSLLYLATEKERGPVTDKWIFRLYRQNDCFLMVKRPKLLLRTEGFVPMCMCCCLYRLLMYFPLYCTKKIFEILPLLFGFNFKKPHFSPLLGSETFCFLPLWLCLFFWVMLQNHRFPSQHVLDGFIFHLRHAALQEGIYKRLGLFWSLRLKIFLKTL